ncbi:MAG TPA: hypothetical protein DD658_01420 [Deltaproteobacteria bacterium]|nr:MAG: hypothetical protein A2X88_01170 [Deltaproteobacteria bacterium GWC2_65_14]HBO68864.1 hypothetical protein [Deltaproteobacteria bacterium]
MGRGKGKFGRRAWLAVGLSGLVLAWLTGTAAAEYPRKVAIAPFTVLTPQEDLRNIVPVLPRLLSSRLMALSGAEVLLLTPGETPPEDAAKKAGYPLLLRGTVAKLGGGYSIDLAAADLAGGKAAGAFFASADTIDAIIPRLDDLAADISEKLFGVKTAARVSAPAPAGPPSAYLPPPPAAGQTPPAVPSEASVPPSAKPSAVPPLPAKDWTPSSLSKVAESGRIADELYGIVSGDVDSEGNGEVVAYGKKILHLYRVKGSELLPFTRITEGLPDHIFNVEAVDLDGDGGKEILVTGLDGEEIRSSVWKRKGDIYEKIAGRIPYHVVLLPDWQGKAVLVGQQKGGDTPFSGKIYEMSWDGKSLAKGAPLPADTSRAPLTSGVMGLSSARFGEQWRWIYTDENDNLRVLDAVGSTEYKTGMKYGWSGDSFEWGLYLPRVGKTRYPVRKAVRVSRDPGGRLTLLVPEQGDQFINIEAFSRAKRLVLLQWSGGEIVEKAGTPKGDRIYSGADYLPGAVLIPGGKVIASAIERSGGVLKGGISRLVLFRVE